jgi:hypothetical protein
MTDRTQFDPAEVPINYTLNLAQVNLILECLAEIPRKRTDGFFEQFRDTAVQALQAAEKAHYQALEKQSAKVAPPPSPDPLCAEDAIAAD